jgi:DNA repair exonuclease SbcCD ATPase subunit
MGCNQDESLHEELNERIKEIKELKSEIQTLKDQVYTMPHTSGSWRCEVAERLAQASAEVKRLKAEAAQRTQGPNPIIQRVANAVWRHVGDPEESARTRYQLIVHDIASFLTCLSEDVNENARTALESMTGMMDSLQTYEWLKVDTQAGIRKKQELLDTWQKQINESAAKLKEEQEKFAKAKSDLDNTRARHARV